MLTVMTVMTALGCAGCSVDMLDGGPIGADAATDAGSPDRGPAGADGSTATVDGGESPPTPDASMDGDASTGADATIEPPRRVCDWVAHIGDSLTAYTDEALDREYRAHGLDIKVIHAHGGRAILQKLRDDPRTGRDAALDIRAYGFVGCWVIALGTNDTANIARGAWYTRAEAIDEMMSAIDEAGVETVLWVNTYTTRTDGYWSNGHMEQWNAALEEATARWPNMRVLDWAATAATGVAPFADGIHHTGAGYAVRNRTIVEAVASLR
jgi:hypothetical protein